MPFTIHVDKLCHKHRSRITSYRLKIFSNDFAIIQYSRSQISSSPLIVHISRERERERHAAGRRKIAWCRITGNDGHSSLDAISSFISLMRHPTVRLFLQRAYSCYSIKPSYQHDSTALDLTTHFPSLLNVEHSHVYSIIPCLPRFSSDRRMSHHS